MKRALSLLAMLAIVPALAQTTPTQTTPAQQPAPQRPTEPITVVPRPANPPRPGVPTAPNPPSAAAFSNAASRTLPNAFNATNPGVGTVGGTEEVNTLMGTEQALLDLQRDIEQILPELFSLTTRPNVNFLQIPATPVGAEQGAVAPGARNQPLPPTGNLNPRLLARDGFVGTLGTNIFVTDPQTFRLLAILRNDLQQTLPVLRALNGSITTGTTGVTGATPVNPGVVSTFATRFVFVTNFQLAPNQPRTLMPTGR